MRTFPISNSICGTRHRRRPYRFRVIRVCGHTGSWHLPRTYGFLQGVCFGAGLLLGGFWYAARISCRYVLLTPPVLGRWFVWKHLEAPLLPDDRCFQMKASTIIYLEHGRYSGRRGHHLPTIYFSGRSERLFCDNTSISLSCRGEICMLCSSEWFSGRRSVNILPTNLYYVILQKKHCCGGVIKHMNVSTAHGHTQHFVDFGEQYALNFVLRQATFFVLTQATVCPKMTTVRASEKTRPGASTK